MRFPKHALLTVLLVLGASACRTPVIPPTADDPLVALSERLATPHYVFHYSPGDFVDVQRSEAYATWASAFFSVTLPRPIEYYKWKDRAQAWDVGEQTTTGLAYPFPEIKIYTYLPWMNHEVCHIYSLQHGRPTAFFTEGIAVAYQIDPFANDFVARDRSGVPIHDVAVQLKAAGRLLPFTNFITADGWAASDYTITYNEAGSFVRYLTDTFGLVKMQALFVSFGAGANASAATVTLKFQQVYGFSLATAETQWLAFLDAR